MSAWKSNYLKNEFTHKFDIQKRTIVTDSSGNKTETWINLTGSPFWCKPEDSIYRFVNGEGRSETLIELPVIFNYKQEFTTEDKGDLRVIIKELGISRAYKITRIEDNGLRKHGVKVVLNGNIWESV